MVSKRTFERNEVIMYILRYFIKSVPARLFKAKRLDSWMKSFIRPFHSMQGGKISRAVLNM